MLGIRALIARAGCIPAVRACYRATLRVPGLSTAARTVVGVVVPLGTQVWARVHSGEGRGLWLKLDPRWNKAYLEGWYEPLMQELLRQHLGPGDVFYDVGAHIGFFTMIAARLVGPRGRVFAFEAAPENAATLHQNAEKNTFGHIEVEHVAVWSKCGHLRFTRPYAGALAGTALELGGNSSRLTHGTQIEVPAITLDCFAEKHLPPSLIKLDVEGAEADVLHGAGKLFRKHKPVLICEVHHECAATSVQAWLAENGYEFGWLPGTVFPRHLVARPGRAQYRSAREQPIACR